MNKQIGFDPKLVKIILSGQKTATWRIDDKRNLSVNDICDFINSETRQKFATAKITNVFSKPFKDLTEEDRKGHEKYSTEQEMYETFEGYYKKPIGPETIVKVIWFDLVQ